MKKLLTLILCLVLALSLAACGNEPAPTDPTTNPTTEPTTEPSTEPALTAEQVYASVSEAMEDALAYSLKMSLSYEMSLTQGDGDEAVTTEMVMDMSVETLISPEPFGAYLLTDMVMRSDGLDMGYSMENYLVEENDTVVQYIGMTYAGSEPFWGKVDTYESADAYLVSLYPMTSTESVWSGSVLEDISLDENTTLNGKEVYVLRGMIPAGDMSDAFADLGVSDPSVYENLTMPVVYYIDAETYLVLRMEANFAFLSDILSDVLAQSVIDALEDVVVELNIPDVVYELCYDLPTIPAVPQEALDYIENPPEPTEPEVYEGPLVLNCGNEVLELTCPEGYTGYFDETSVWMSDEEFNYLVQYIYYAEGGKDAVMAVIQDEIDFLENYITDTVIQAEGPAIEGYETKTLDADIYTECFAWREAGDGWLLIWVTDYAGTDGVDALLPMFIDCLSPYSNA